MVRGQRLSVTKRSAGLVRVSNGLVAIDTSKETVATLDGFTADTGSASRLFNLLNNNLECLLS